MNEYWKNPREFELAGRTVLIIDVMTYLDIKDVNLADLSSLKCMWMFIVNKEIIIDISFYKFKTNIKNCIFSSVDSELYLRERVDIQSETE